MSANFNIAMLRSIQQPLAESMEAIIAQLTRLLAGQIQGNELDQGQHAKLVRGSLEMIGCQAISRLASTLERGCEALVMPERRGWDRSRVEQVGKSLLLLAEGLDDQIKHMLVDNEDLPVRLWPVWAHVYETMGEPVPTPEDLFEPDPNFEDEKFQPLAIDYLGQVCEGMSERLTLALGQLESARDGAGVAKSLREAERVFNWAYGLRHRRGYQAYWLVMRARMAIGLIQDPALLEDKASWTVLLNEASIELQKFAKDALRVRPDLLLKVIRPLLTPWPQSWTNAHPALGEMDARMGLSVFWKTVAEVQDQKLQLAVSQFVAHQEELLSLLAGLRSEWTRYVSGEGRAADPEVARANVVHAVKELSAKRMLFSDPSAIVMLEAISRISERMPRFDAVSEEMALEFASSVLVVEDSVERRGRVSPEFHEQSRTQQKRLSAAWDGNLSELAALPLVRWDSKKQERQTRQALVTVFQEIRKDLSGVEEILVENFRGESSRPLERDGMRDTLSLAAAVLRTLMCDPASRVVRALNDRLQSIPASGAISQVLQDEITLGITGLTSFLAARESGDEDAENLLVGAVRILLGEPLRKEVDPSLLVPPPEQDVVLSSDHGLPSALDVQIVEQAPEVYDTHEPDDHAQASGLVHEDIALTMQSAAEEFHDEEDAVGSEFETGPDAGQFDPGFAPLVEQPAPAVPSTFEESALAVTSEDMSAGLPMVAREDLSDEQLNILVVEGMWDVPSEKEPDLVHFLLDESESVLMEIILQAGILEHDPTNEEARQSLRRQFHTIKGSGRIAGVVALAQAAWWVENMLTEDEVQYPAYRPLVDAVVKSAHQQFTQWFEELRSHSRVWVQAQDLRSDIDAIALLGGLPSDVDPSHAQEVALASEDIPELHPTVEIEDFSMEEGGFAPAVSISRGDEGLDEALDAESAALQALSLEGAVVEDGAVSHGLTEEDAQQGATSMDLPAEEMGLENMAPEPALENQPEALPVVVAGLGEFDPELFSLFEEDARVQVDALRSCLVMHDAGHEVNTVLLSRAAHTLASLAGGMEMQDVRRLARSIEKTLDLNPEDAAPADMILPDALAHGARAVADAIEDVYVNQNYLGVDEGLIEAIEALSHKRPVDQEDIAAVVDLSDLPAVVLEDLPQGRSADEDEDELIDSIIDKMSEVTEKLQEATMLLIQLSERRR